MKVSICIPTYNQGLYIEKAIRSAALQTVKPFEIIVYDDCSTDETPQILQRLAKEFSPMRSTDFKAGHLKTNISAAPFSPIEGRAIVSRLSGNRLKR